MVLQISNVYVCLLISAEWLKLEVSGVGGDRQNTERVRVPKPTLPSLDSNDRGVRLDDLELQRVLQPKADTVIYL